MNIRKTEENYELIVGKTKFNVSVNEKKEVTVQYYRKAEENENPYGQYNREGMLFLDHRDFEIKEIIEGLKGVLSLISEDQPAKK